MTCMTPRALALETIELLKPLSCQAIAEASDGETPCAEATLAMSPALTRSGVACGAAAGTTVVAGAGASAAGGVGEPVGSLMTVPASRYFEGSSPFMLAM